MIKIHELTKTFHNVTAVNHISLLIPQNCIFGLLGTNGAGKSTLLRMLAGILKPDSGTILIDQKQIWDNEATKKECFYLSDKQFFFHNASPEAMGGFYKTLYPEFDYERFLNLLEEFDLNRILKIRTFSKGMQKQVGILTAICSNVPYLFCDEVFDGLDPVIRRSVTSLIKSEMEHRSFTLITASHNLNELEDFCDHIGILHKGGILLSKDIHSMQYQTYKLQCILDEKQMSVLEEFENIVTIRQEGFLTTILIRGTREEITEQIESLKPEKYNFLPLSLEEIFINETEAIGYDIKLLFS